MVSKTLEVATVYPSGTVLQAFRGSLPDSTLPGDYPGTPVDSGTVTSAGNVTFTGLTEDTGYVASGLVGSGYRFVEFSTAPARTGLTLDSGGELSDGSGSVVLAARAPISVKDYGATGDGVTDDTDAIQDALTAGAATGREVLLDGTHVISSTLTLVSNNRLRGLGKSTLDFSAQTATFTALTATGTVGTGVALTGNATLGDVTLNVPSTGFADNDWVKVYSEEVVDSQGHKAGEQCRLSSAATMALFDPLQDSYTTANTATVAKVTHVTDISIENVFFQGPSDNTLSITGLLVTRGRNIRVSGCTFTHCHYRASTFIDSIAVKVYACHYQDNTKTGFAYGITFANACQDCTAMNCTGIRMRHLVTHGGSTSVYGLPRRTTTMGCTASQMMEAAFDCHPGGEDISFIGCTVMGSEQDGIVFQASSGVVEGNNIQDCARHGVLLQDLTGRPMRVVVANNQIDRVGTVGGIGISATTKPSYPEVGGLIITGNMIDTCAKGISLNGTNGAFSNCTVANNVIRNASSHGMDLNTLTRCTVNGNTVECLSASTSGIYARAFTDCTIADNVVRFASTSSTLGIRVGGASVDTTVTGNRVVTAGTGVRLEDTATYCVVMGNNVRGCTTPLNLGSGTGHISTTSDASGAYNRV